MSLDALRAAAVEKAKQAAEANKQNQAAAVPAAADAIPVDQQRVPAATPTGPNVRVFHHPSAGSTTIMPNGRVLVFAGAMKGQGERRIVGEGFCETSDPEEIAWLESVAKQRSNMVSEVLVNRNTGEVAAVVTAKPVDPNIQKAAADAARNTAAVQLDPEGKQIAAAIKSGTQTDLQAGVQLQPDTSMQQAVQQALAAGDQSKTGTVHNG